MGRSPFQLALLALALVAFVPAARAQTDPRDPARPVVLRDPAGRIRRAWGLDLEVAGATPRERAERVLDDRAIELAVEPSGRWIFDRTTRAHGLDVVRLHRERDGMRVLGASAVVQLSSRGRAMSIAVAGAALPDIAGGARITAEQATRLALAASTSGARAVRVERALEPGRDSLIPVWRIVLGRSLLDSTEVLVDARDGSIRRAASTVRTARGRVYESDAAARAGAVSEVELLDLLRSDQLDGRDVRVLSECDGTASCAPGPRAMPDARGDYLFAPDPLRGDDEFAQVSAYHHVSRYAQDLRARHGFELDCDEVGLAAVVNYAPDGDPVENAFYALGLDGGCGAVVFGQGRRGDYAYDRDIVQHEAGHAVFAQLVQPAIVARDEIGPSNDPALLDEGSADYLAATLAGRPVVDTYFGDEIDRRFDGVWTCADRTGEAHDDGRIWAAFGWAARDALGAEKADALMFTTIASLDSASTLRAAFETLRATSSALVAAGALTADDDARIDALLRERALDACSRTVPLDDCATRLRFGRDTRDVFYSLRVPRDARTLRIVLTRASGSGAARFAIDRTLRWEGDTVDADREIPLAGRDTIEWRREEGLPVGSTLHFGLRDVASTSARYIEVRASFELEVGATCGSDLDAAVPHDASVVASVRGGGCACASATPRGSRRSAWLAIFALACVISERRARARRAAR